MNIFFCKKECVFQFLCVSVEILSDFKHTARQYLKLHISGETLLGYGKKTFLLIWLECSTVYGCGEKATNSFNSELILTPILSARPKTDELRLLVPGGGRAEYRKSG